MASSSRGTKYCAAANCDSITHHLYSWPHHQCSTNEQRRLWTAFVKVYVKNFTYKKSSRLCFRHFTPDCFSNWGEYVMLKGESVKLSLKKEAGVIPTIQLTSEDNIVTPRKQQDQNQSTPMIEVERRNIIRDLVKTTVPAVAKTITLPRRRLPSKIPVPVYLPSTAEEIGPGKSSQVDKGIQLRRCLHRPKFRSMQTQTDPIVTGLPPDEVPTKKKKGEHIAKRMETESLSNMKCYLMEAMVSDSSDDDEGNCENRNLLEESVDEDWVMDSDEEKDYDAEQADNQNSYHVGERKWYNEPKIIVCHHKLEELLQVCPMCGGFSAVEMKETHGGAVRYLTHCLTCHHVRDWSNTDKVGRTHLVNLLACAGILFTGCLPTKVVRMMAILNIKFPNTRSFSHYQKTYLHGVIREVSSHMFSQLHSSLQGKPLRLNGDGRFNSPGHSALYGIYTLMDAESSKIVACELVNTPQSTETNSSPKMELEGLKRCRKYLDEKTISVLELTTDRHSGIVKYMADSWSEVTHYFDTWHLAKSVRKRMAALANRKVANHILHKWVPAIVDHLHHVVNKTPCGQLRREWWMSVVHHMCNVHRHNYETFPECRHGELEEVKYDDEGYKLVVAYLNPEIQKDLINDVASIINDLASSVDKAGPTGTSELEGFHSCVNRNAPKMEGFSYSGMLSRVLLTILHHNENCQRPVKLTKDGKKMRRIQRSKATKQVPTIQYVREDPTYDYVAELLQNLHMHVEQGTKPDLNDKSVPTLASTGPSYSSLDEVEAQTEAKRRGLQVKPHYVTTEEMALAHRRATRGRGKSSLKQ